MNRALPFALYGLAVINLLLALDDLSRGSLYWVVDFGFAVAAVIVAQLYKENNANH